MRRYIYTILLLFVGTVGFNQEICDNGIDDDLAGLVDLYDTTDCRCEIATPDTVITSLIPNPSFEARTCCPSTLSQLTCANNWIQASNATSDYFNTCGVTGIGTFQRPALPLPGGGAGYVGFYSSLNWEENIGTCLSGPMVAGTSYTLSIHLAWARFDSLFNFRLYGTPNCTDLPWATNTCPVGSGSWVQLAGQAVQLSNTGAWTQIFVTFTPTVNINAISIGGACGGQATAYSYYYADELILNKSSKFFSPVAKITDTGHYCQGNLILKSNYDSVPNSFQWYKDSIAIVGATDTNFSVPNGGTGIYQVRMIYDSGCVVTEPFLVDTTIITFDKDSLGTCPLGLQTGLISFKNVAGGTAPYEFQLNSGVFVTDTFFNNLSPGTYNLTVRDTNLCPSYSSITVESFPMPTASFEVDSVCFGLATTFTDNSTITSGNITQWGWNTPGNPTTQNTSFTSPLQGTFPITHTVVSDSGCIDDTTINVVVHPLPVANFTYSPQEIYTFNPDVCFINSSSGAISYNWDFDFAGPTGTSTLSDPCLVRFPANQEKTYRVKLTAMTQHGCVDSVFVNVIILDEFLLYVPNAFSPNGDNVNDELVITSAGVATYTLRIFDRWGNVIFESSDITKTWDGKHNGTDVEDGVYLYKIDVKGENDEVKEVIGHINLLR